MRQINTQIDIDASPDKVWSLLLDFESYAQWNPFIQRASGRPEVGQKLEILMVTATGKSLAIEPVVIAAQPTREFRWVGHRLIRGLLDVEYYYMLRTAEDGRTRFVHGAVFTGLLSPFWGGFVNSALRGFFQMNEALKELAEHSVAG